MKSKIFFVAASIAMLFTACSAPKNITYFQDMQPGMSITPQNPIEIKLKPSDEVNILVSTRDQDLSRLFSKGGGVSANTAATNTMNNINFGKSQNAAYTYRLDSKGFIDFPVLGPIHVEGMNREELQEYIKNELINQNLVKDPIVTVEFSNLYVMILGETGSGRIPIDKDMFTILDAISQAGDLKISGQRENVKVIRENYGKQTAYEINLCKANELYASPVFYLQQNDVIYVEPNDKVKRTSTEYGSKTVNYTFWTGLLTTALTIGTLVYTIAGK